MKIIADTHCHTVASGHAFSTLLENVQAAKSAGLWAVATTDHIGKIPDAPGPWYFENLRIIPNSINNIKILKGVEANIINSAGDVDLPEMKIMLDWVIASLHDLPFEGPHGIKECTDAWLGVAENPRINVIGHSGTVGFEYDYESVIPVFGQKKKLVEINNSSHVSRIGSTKNCLEIARICKKYQVPVIVNSDAHFSFQVGKFEHAIALLESINFPEELVINSSISKFEKYLELYSQVFK
ncbi:MAG: phosphatase [Candidatus Improbicoccus devescovinae]|nr:MAG: phosphatase [Candidatus Improbicoccus devescovinae]